MHKPWRTSFNKSIYLTSLLFLVKSCKFDFEDGLSSWVRNGTAFNNQPTYGDNPTARGTDPARQQGNWWIGTFEDRPSTETLSGKGQGDGIQGYLTSPSFNIVGKYISFLIGGGCDINLIRAELIVGSQVSTMLHFPLSSLYKRKNIWLKFDATFKFVNGRLMMSTIILRFFSPFFQFLQQKEHLNWKVFLLAF